jgi:2-polyprenyl-3-methyl-5-hydroxy-6-metoxy-1,4-benzoquinol methylase
MDRDVSTANGERPRYWSTPEEGPATRVELELIPDGSRVLEIGTAAGHVTRALKRKGCEVTGIELDEELARLAAPACRRIIVGDIETLDLDTELAEEFDVVLCGDVLEHLKNPDAALQKLKRRLAPTGQLVVSIPNVAHGSIRLSLLQGRFSYVPEGLLDATHLRFFTHSSLVEFFDRNGLEIRDLHRARVGLFDTEIALAPSKLSAFVVRQVVQDPEATTYQFVFRAIPSGHSSKVADLRDSAFDPNRERRKFADFCVRRAWAVLHGETLDRREVRAWAWLALVSQPTPKAAIYWVVSFSPLRFWST